MFCRWIPNKLVSEPFHPGKIKAMAQKQNEEWKVSTDSRLTDIERSMQGMHKAMEKIAVDMTSKLKLLEDGLNDSPQNEKSEIVEQGESSQKMKGVEKIEGVPHRDRNKTTVDTRSLKCRSSMVKTPMLGYLERSRISKSIR